MHHLCLYRSSYPCPNFGPRHHQTPSAAPAVPSTAPSAVPSVVPSGAPVVSSVAHGSPPDLLPCSISRSQSSPKYCSFSCFFPGAQYRSFSCSSDRNPIRRSHHRPVRLSRLHSRSVGDSQSSPISGARNHPAPSAAPSVAPSVVPSQIPSVAPSVAPVVTTTAPTGTPVTQAPTASGTAQTEPSITFSNTVAIDGYAGTLPLSCRPDRRDQLGRDLMSVPESTMTYVSATAVSTRRKLANGKTVLSSASPWRPPPQPT
jgi:hypothetical protein